MPQAEEPEVPEELSSATTSESSSSSQEEDPLGVQRAIQDINREEAELWNRIRANPACLRMSITSSRTGSSQLEFSERAME